MVEKKKIPVYLSYAIIIVLCLFVLIEPVNEGYKFPKWAWYSVLISSALASLILLLDKSYRHPDC
jgi:hypothetical protein